MKQAAGYTSQPRATDPRSTEAWALAEVSRRLILASKETDNSEGLRAALILNQRLWSIFQGALIDPECPLPKAIRDNVLALSVMMDRHLMHRLADLDGSKIQPILDINRAIADGLSMNDVAAQPVAEPRPQPATGAAARPFMNVTA